jgi:CubicO group peptidase (beta-lactamase class C family)
MYRSSQPWLLVALLAVCPIARGEATCPSKFDLKAIDAYLEGQIKPDGFVGLSVAIVQNGKVVLAKGYGKRSLDPAAAVETSTPFAAGSVTKQFTAACILLLAEEGKLSVHDPVSKWYPDLTKAKEITLYELMSHTSGYPDYYPLDFVDRRLVKPIPPDDLIKEYAGGKLDFEPGHQWSYSNTGFIILGRVIEKVSGQPFGEFLHDRILKPLEMNDSVLDPKGERKDLARGYTAFALGSPETAVPEANGWLYGAGGLFTTPSDMAKWDVALMTGKVLKPDSLRLMTSPVRLSDGRFAEYGCGIGLRRGAGETIWRHGGAVSGYLSFNYLLPRTRSAFILMANSENQDAGELFEPLFDLLVSAQPRASRFVPKINGPSAKDAALDLLQQLQGGEVKRELLGDDYSSFLTPERTKGAKERLGQLGEPMKVDADPPAERGGMEVVTVHFTFRDRKIKGLMYRTPDGKIQEFLIYKE